MESKDSSTHNNKLLVLSMLNKKLYQGIDFEAFLKEAADQIAFAMDAARVTIYLLDKKRGELWSKVAHLSEISEIRLKVGQGVAGHVADTGETINIPTSYKDKRFYSGIDQKTGFKTMSQLSAPIHDQGKEILGVVQVLNKKDGVFTLEDEQFLEILCAQFALLIENSSLYRVIKSTRLRNTRTFPLVSRYNNIIGTSPAMAQIFTMISKVAPTPVTVMIRGESGTGKEMVARAIHLNSPRKNKPFIKIDCTTLPETLLENELFGHAKGAYTGATTKAPGKIEVAQDGTLFIDEIGDIPLSMQGKLLRVLQDRQYEPLGATQSIKIRSRILAATNQDLEKMVLEQKFRKDLYFRIKVAQLFLPPSRERGEKDIVALSEHFLDLFKKQYGKNIQVFTEESLELLANYSWPGNVRELQNCIETAVIFAEDKVIMPDNLTFSPLFLNEEEMTNITNISLKEMEKRHIKKILKSVDGNRVQASKILQIGRNTLLRKIEEYGLK